MSETFSRTLRSLDAGGSRRRAGVYSIVVLLVARAAWFFLGKVTIYEVTDRTRLEVTSAAHPVAAAVGGQVVETRLTIGRPVSVGEVLVVLDAEAERRALQERRARHEALRARLEALAKEAEAEQETIAAQRKARGEAGEFRVGSVVVEVLGVLAGTDGQPDHGVLVDSDQLGRQLEARLRVGFLDKIPRLNDRCFQSWPTSDMAERSHNIHQIRLLPRLAGQFLRAALTLIITAAAIAWIDPASAPLALVAAGIAVGLPRLRENQS
jgi:hypothetical protein